MSCFIDTSAIYGLLVRTEREHAALRDAFRDVAEKARRIVTTNYVLLESCALLQHRIGVAPVRDLEEKIVPLLEIRFVDAHLHAAGMQRLLRGDKRGVSLVDAVSFEVMHVEGLSDVLGLDSDFEEEGFRLIP